MDHLTYNVVQPQLFHPTWDFNSHLDMSQQSYS